MLVTYHIRRDEDNADATSADVIGVSNDMSNTSALGAA